MAIYRPAQLIGAITGTLGSVDFVQGASGPYVRTRPRSTNPNTIAQSARRARFKTMTGAWRQMTDAQREAWRQAGALANFRNRLGTPRKLSGYQLFMRENLTKELFLSVTKTAPNVLTSTPAPTNIAIHRAAGQPIIATYTIEPPSTDQTIRVFCARPVSSGQRQHYSNWKFVVFINSVVGLSAVPITNQFFAVLGTPQVGERVGIRITAQAKFRLRSYAVTSDGVML